MTYTTLKYNGTEKSLADWGISSWSRNVQNQADDSFTFTIPTPMDGADIFSYGAQIIIAINRVNTAHLNPLNPTLPISGSTSFTGGTQWFVGYCVDNDRTGDPGAEFFNYKFVGPYQFFFDRLIFQKLQLTWNGAKQVADYQSDVILGLSLTTLTGTGDTVTGTTATNLFSIAQQIKEICMYAQADSAYQQSTNGLGWSGTNQFACDQLATAIDSVNWDLLDTPSANVLISDYAYGAVAGKTCANTTGQILRAPLDAVNAITCAEAMRRQLQWLGGIGSPVVWTDHSTTPPTIRVGTRDQLPAVSLALAGITVKTKIKKRTDLIPAAVHFKYKVSGTYLGQPYSVVINDVATYISGVLVEGIGQLGALTYVTGGTLGDAIGGSDQAALMAAGKTATAITTPLDFQGDQVNASSCKITCGALTLGNPSGGGTAETFWKNLFPEIAGYSGIAFCKDSSSADILPTITDPTGATTYYTAGAWTGTTYGNRVTDGQVAPWMLADTSTPANPVGGKTIKAIIHAKLSYSEATTPNVVSYKEVNKEVTLSTLTSGTYYSNPSVAYGEPLPYGLAGYILALENIPQFEGAITVQETEISDVCPVGNVLNITGGLAAWATMNACIQSVRYADNGQTEITFGPAKHLGPAQFVARFRNNVGPRWFNLIGGDPMNQSNPGTSVMGANIPASCTGAGAQNETFKGFLTNLAANIASPATQPAGVHIDTGAAASPFTGTPPSTATAFSQGQAVVVAQGPTTGVAGEANAWIRLSLGDLKNTSGVLQNKQIYLREFKTCFDFGSGPVDCYALVLSSYPYATSIHAASGK